MGRNSAGIRFAVLTFVIPITLVPTKIMTSEPVTDIYVRVAADNTPTRTRAARLIIP